MHVYWAGNITNPTHTSVVIFPGKHLTTKNNPKTTLLRTDLRALFRFKFFQSKIRNRNWWGGRTLGQNFSIVFFEWVPNLKPSSGTARILSLKSRVMWCVLCHYDSISALGTWTMFIFVLRIDIVFHILFPFSKIIHRISGPNCPFWKCTTNINTCAGTST